MNNSPYGPSSHLIVTNLPTTPTALLFYWRTMQPNFGVMYLCIFIKIKFERCKLTSRNRWKGGWAISYYAALSLKVIALHFPFALFRPYLPWSEVLGHKSSGNGFANIMFTRVQYIQLSTLAKAVDKPSEIQVLKC